MDLDSDTVDLFRARGIDVKRVRGMARLRYVVETKTREHARIVLNLLDREKCFLEQPGYPSEPWSYRTTWPTSYAYRFFHDRGTRWEAAKWLPFFPLWMAIALAVLSRAPSGAGFALVVTAPVAVVWWLFMRALRHESGGFEMRGMVRRFLLGAVVAAALVLLAGWAYSWEDILLPLWVFLAVNGVWIGTVGYDRWLFENELDKVGRRSELEAWHLLNGLPE